MRARIKKYFAIFLATLLVFAASGCSGRNTDKTAAITTAIAGNRELETTLDLSGVLAPAQTVDISSKISGQVIKLGFHVGSNVKAGNILMQLDTEALKAQLLQAEAGLQSSEAAAQSVQNQALLAEINLNAAQKAYDRTIALYETGAVPQSQMDDMRDKLNIAKNQLENAAGPALNQAQAAINTARANIKNLQVQIGNATITSPLSGIITNQNINVGEVVSPGVPVISIVDVSTLKMKSTITQDELPLLSTGWEMNVTINSYPDSKFKGAITSIGPIAVNTGEVFPIEITIKNNGSLTAGLSAYASMIIKTKGIAVPASSVIQNNGESYVFVIKDNIASKRAVKTGLKNDKEILILNGLAAGERVAVTNVKSLTDGKPIKEILNS